MPPNRVVGWICDECGERIIGSYNITKEGKIYHPKCSLKESPKEEGDEE